MSLKLQLALQTGKCARPARGRAGKIKANDVVEVLGEKVDYLMLVEEIKGKQYIGVRVYDGRLVPTKVTDGSGMSLTVVHEEGGLARFIMEGAKVGVVFNLETIADEQEAIVQIARWPERSNDVRFNEMVARAEEIIQDPQIKFDVLLSRKIECSDFGDRAGHPALVGGLTAEQILYCLGRLPEDLNSSWLAPLLDRFAAIDINAFAKWIGKVPEGDARDRVDTAMKFWFKNRAHLQAFQTPATLHSRCIIARRMDGGTWRDEGCEIFEKLARGDSDEDLWLACFLYMHCDTHVNDDDPELFAPLLDSAERAVRRLGGGERPDVPWELVFSGHDVFVGITEGECDRWIKAIASWRA